MATVESTPPLTPLTRVPQIRDYKAPGWFDRLPNWLGTGAVLVVLIAISAFIRSRDIGGQYWSDEANTIGIASHSLGAIPGILRQGGGAPLYYYLLHFWMLAFGATESATHGLSLLFGLISIPVAMWAGWSLFGRRAGYMAATLFAFNSFLTEYAAETRMYELLALLGLIAVTSFLHAFVFRRRGYMWLFAACLALMLYADAAGLWFFGATAVALVPAYLRSDDRAGVLRDGLIAFAAVAIVYLPWVPTLIHQAGSATAPWDYAPVPGLNFPRSLLGTDRVDAVFAIAVTVGCVPLLMRERRQSRDATSVLVLVVISVAAVLLVLLGSLLAPTWLARYFAPLVGVLLLLVTFASARSGWVGLAAIIASCAFLANAASFVPQYKSDMRDISGELQGYMRRGDLVVVAQPEQAPLAWYYLPAGLRYATTLGPDPHPTYMNWDDADRRLLDADPKALVSQLIGSLAPGQRLLYIRPLTEGQIAWSSSWASLVRRRAAQWGRLLSSAPDLTRIPGAWAPHNYRGSCCVASSAYVFTKR